MPVLQSAKATIPYQLASSPFAQEETKAERDKKRELAEREERERRVEYKEPFRRKRRRSTDGL